MDTHRRCATARCEARWIRNKVVHPPEKEMVRQAIQKAEDSFIIILCFFVPFVSSLCQRTWIASECMYYLSNQVRWQAIALATLLTALQCTAVPLCCSFGTTGLVSLHKDGWKNRRRMGLLDVDGYKGKTFAFNSECFWPMLLSLFSFLSTFWHFPPLTYEMSKACIMHQ